ncbi:MAG: sel1 repeat family protein [Nitrospira sp.]|nr:sel1 repeat family protein [Nitrospira sp.]MCP9463323.1 sel1 repeat family protein [Nitrospira sp.]
MGKQGYPGLVLVPPSDRQIARRRLTRWALLAVGCVGGISALNIWLPAPHEYADCPQSLDLSLSADPPSPCQQVDQSSSHQREGFAAPTTVASLGKPTDLEKDPARPDHQEIAVKRSTGKRLPTQQKAGQVPVTPLASSSLSRTPEDARHDSLPTLAASAAKAAAHVASRQEAQPETRSSSPFHAPAPPQVVARQRGQQEPSSVFPTSPVTSASPPSGAVRLTRDHELAERGDAFAQYRLGRFYAQRDGQHAPESVGWYSKASAGLRRLAEAGNGEAMYVLGVMYAFGRGVKRDTEEARRWLSRAIDHRITAARPVLASVEKHRLAEVSRTDHGG